MYMYNSDQNVRLQSLQIGFFIFRTQSRSSQGNKGYRANLNWEIEEQRQNNYPWEQGIISYFWDQGAENNFGSDFGKKRTQEFFKGTKIPLPPPLPLWEVLSIYCLKFSNKRNGIFNPDCFRTFLL